MSWNLAGHNNHDGLHLEHDTGIVDAIRELQRSSDGHALAHVPAEQRVQTARSAIAVLEDADFHRFAQLDVRVRVVRLLQKVAYPEPGGAGVTDIANWCTNQWLAILQVDKHNPAALRGLGQAWLSRSQTILARIHRTEGSSSSGSSGWPHSHSDRLPYTSADDHRDAERAVAEADARAHTADYVEARGILLPAVDYFASAVDASEGAGQLSGDLLAEAAEASMSLGNVTYSHHNEQYFHRAIRYLRRASRIHGYRLSPYLQSYLDDYGRLID